MIKKVFRVLFAVLGAILFLLLANLLFDEHILGFIGWQKTVFLVGASLVTAILFYFLSRPVFRLIEQVVERLEKEFQDIPSIDLLFGILGLVIGLILAFLISQPLLRLQIPYLGNVPGVLASIVLYIFLGYLGQALANQKKRDFPKKLLNLNKLREAKEKDPRELLDRKKKKKDIESAKILDTSVIIDGRIGEIIDAGFLEGTVVIAQFVLEELQHIADSEDHLRRARGRRGLDLINEIQEKGKIPVYIDGNMYPQVKEVDMKLLHLTQDLDGKILTNDYNLNKVARVRGIPVLNINELANAMKPVVVTGEKITVEIVRTGKERSQGIAYLEDGTMIVIEDGKFHIGKTKEVEVTSVLQTAAGKMIFAKLADK